MPDLDSPQIMGILEQGSPTKGVVIGLHLSKRPRDEAIPPPGKRGRAENIGKSLTLQIPVPSAPLPTPGGNGSPQAPAPLCESPIANQASSTPPPGFAAAVPGDDGAVKHAENFPTEPASLVAMPPVIPGGAGLAAAKRKSRIPATAAPSVGATDPIFHAAILRVLHRRGGNTCPEAKAWRWSGASSARFDHWPSVLHPAVMDLLASVSASEERVVLAGCDAHDSVCRGDDGRTTQLTPPLLPPPPPSARRGAVWRAPVPRTPVRRAAATGPGIPLPATPVSHSRAFSGVSGATPLSALRRPGSTRRSGGNRVRFSTHDMSVVDTPDPARDGSEKGMVSAMDGLESILAAAEEVQRLVAQGRSNGGGVEWAEERTGSRPYEGYFDRFGSTASREAEEPAVGGDASPGQDSAVTALSYICSGQQMSDENSGGGHSIGQAEQRADGPQPGDENSVQEDAAALVSVLEEIACSDSAPEEVKLAGGWGPEHSNAAAFYATELASLCGVDSRAQASELGAVGSHLRSRYLDVLSCLVRYNLKLLLNVCSCEAQATALEQEEMMAVEDQIDEDCEGGITAVAEMDDTCDTNECPTRSTSPSTLTVVVPGRAASSERSLSDATAWAERGCGCVTVLDGTGALEFNTEDVAALLTLALGRVHPFVDLEACVAAAASAGDRGGDEGEDFGQDDDVDVYDDSDAVDARVWVAVQQYTFEGRTVAAVASGAAGGASQSGLFPDEVSETIAESRDDDAAAVSRVAALSCHPYPGSDIEVEDRSCLTADEAADLLEYVAATRFIAQLIAEPVVAAGIEAGLWTATERLAEQIRKLAKAEEEASAAAWREGIAHGAAPPVSSTLGLGELADVRKLGERMTQQARHAPALEARLRGELRRALRRGQGSRQTRLKSRLQQTTLPDVFCFPMVGPCCSLALEGDAMMT